MTKKLIEVKISNLELMSLSSNSQSAFILNKLKQAGVPVKGIFYFRGLEYGTFSNVRENDGMVYIYNRG